ncbi:AraC family transcriptional regulator [Caballeronia sp. GAFFF2]|uniref:AraC family transcriptional regulator n=1 Tax=Caballeronia sp. GAFFF2 TaxID=2921741 RepID=UPI0020279B00|nr:AraC family transcriptional regulator [Caballeronia sp. GAFFF2]
MIYPTSSSHIPGGRIAKVCRISMPGYRTEWHEHDEYMFLLPALGSLRLKTEANEREQSIGTRVLAIVEPRIFHETMSDSQDNRHTAIYVEKEFVAFCENKAQTRMVGRHGGTHRSPLLFSAPTASLLHSLQLHASLERSSRTHEFERYRSELSDRLVASACIEAAFCARPELGGRETTPEELARHIVEYIDNTLAERPSLDAIAIRFDTSRRKITRVFREATGQSITEFQTRRRVERAAALLNSPGTTVLDAALAVGIESASYLARLFSKHGLGKPGDHKSRATAGSRD